MTIFSNGALVINILLGIMTILAICFGYMNGFLWQVIRIVGLIATVVLSFVLAPGLADLINVIPKTWVPYNETVLGDVFYSKFNTIVWYIIIFVLGIILTIILKPILKAITEVKIVKLVDKSLGVVLSLIPVAIFAIFLTYILSSAIFVNGTQVVDESVLKYIKLATSEVSQVIDDTLQENSAIQKMINNPLTLDENDLTFIIDWLENAQVDSQTIQQFLIEYGVDANKINQLIQKEE